MLHLLLLSLSLVVLNGLEGAAGASRSITRDPQRLLDPSFKVTLSTACAIDIVPSRTAISGGDGEFGGKLRLELPNGTVWWRDPCWTAEELAVLEKKRKERGLGGNGPPNQWLAWMFASLPVYQNGGTYLDNTFTVPPLPKARSNLAMFNGFQPTYDPKTYDYIVQPCLLHGEWLMSSTPGWSGQAVTCIPAAGRCVQSVAFPTEPGHLLRGTVELISGAGTSRLVFNISIEDLSNGKGPVSVTYTTKYMATMAFIGVLEHNPLGPIASCDQLPSGGVTFGNTTCKPAFTPPLSGVLGGDASCGISVPTFPPPDHATITF